MKRSARIAVNLLVPPGVGTLLLITPLLGKEDVTPPISVLPILLFYGYLLGGFASIIHAVMMEWSYQRFLSPDRLWTVAISAASGACGGVLVALQFAALRGFSSFEWMGTLLPIGFVTGIIVGVLVVTLSRLKHESA